MGLKFCENNGGDKMFYCAICFAYLADKKDLVSTNFTGTTGQAFLFKEARNVSFGQLVLRQMMTGHHFVRDAYCVSCNNHLGWMYELAPKDNEKYKEGSVILERLHIIEAEPITTVSQMNTRAPARTLHHRQDPAEAQRIRIHQNIRRRVIDQRNHFRPDFDVEEDEEDDDMELLQFPRQNNNVFRLNANGEPPTVVIHNMDALRESLGINDDQMDLALDTLRRFNIAIRNSAQGNNGELWIMGFRTDTARQYREIRDMMDGEPYRPSPEADANLMLLFDRMNQERQRLAPGINAALDLAEMERFAAENEALIRAQRRIEQVVINGQENDRLQGVPIDEIHLRNFHRRNQWVLEGRRRFAGEQGRAAQHARLIAQWQQLELLNPHLGNH